MADNTTPSANPTIATDDIGGTHYPRVKIGKGVDGAYRDSSDSYTTGTINALNLNLLSGTPTANSHVTVTVPDCHASWTAFLNGTWSAGTVMNFQASPDGIAWYSINGRKSGSAAVNEAVSDLYADVPGTGITVPVNFQGALAGAKYFRVTCSTYTASDSVTVQLATSEAGGAVFQVTPMPASTNRIGQVSLADGVKTTYSALINSTSVASAVTVNRPLFEIQNPTANTTKLIRVTRLEYQLTVATAAAATLQHVKSAVSTGGTAVAQAASTGHDTTNAAASAVVNLYTVAPTAGTPVASQRQRRMWGFATTLTATTIPLVHDFDFGSRPGQAVVLRAGQGYSVQSPVVFATAPTITGSVEWTEELV